MKNMAGIALSLLLISLALESSVAGYISVEPQISSVSAAPGKRTKTTIKVTNTGPMTVVVEIQPEEWGKDNELICSRVEWMDASPKSFKLKPGKSRKVLIVARPGCGLEKERYTQIFFACRNNTANGLGTGVRISSLVKWKIGRLQ